MGGNPRYRLWTARNWRGAAPTVADLQRVGWRVYALCPHCNLQMKVDLKKIARVKGANFELWGKTVICRRLHCWGRASFVCRPDRAEHDIIMVGRDHTALGDPK